MIAQVAGISQGSLFVHFSSKKNLFNEILISNIDELEHQLKTCCSTKKKPLLFMKNMIDILIENENLLVTVYKDEAYLDQDLRKSVDVLENTLKNLLLDNYREHTKQKTSIIDSFVLIDAFLSQLKNYLILKDVDHLSVSVLKQRKGRITKLYKFLFIR